MSDLIEAIKRNADAFIYTAECRAATTPCFQNKCSHTGLSISIRAEDWKRVKAIVELPEYQVAFKRLIWCLNMHSDISSDEHSIILKLVGEQ